MQARDPREHGRAATPLELFFDLVFVVAVSLSSQQLHHLAADGRPGAGVLSYLMVFFAIWWAWVNFTWFATSFDTDDWLYRVVTIVQMGGALVLAAGTAPAMLHHDFTLVTIGYVIMRLALVGQWCRAGLSHPALRGTAFRFASGIIIVQAAWVVRLFVPETVGLIGFFVLAAAEVAVPVWAEHRNPTPWNAHHIVDRYGAFTLIVLGESILASTNATVEALDAGERVPQLLAVSAAGLVIAAGMWWVYFARDHREHIAGLGASLQFGYFHYVIFAAAGAFSAGVEITIGAVTGHADLSPAGAAAMLSVPVAVFLAGVWWLTLRQSLRAASTVLYLLGTLMAGFSAYLDSLAAPIGTAAGVVISVIAVETGAPRPRLIRQRDASGGGTSG